MDAFRCCGGSARAAMCPGAAHSLAIPLAITMGALTRVHSNETSHVYSFLHPLIAHSYKSSNSDMAESYKGVKLYTLTR